MQHKQPQNQRPVRSKEGEFEIPSAEAEGHQFILDNLKEKMLNQGELPHTSEPESAQPVSDRSTREELLLTTKSPTPVNLPPGKNYFRVREVAALLGVGPHVLRFWETEFSMVRPTKSKSGQRVYRRKDVEVLVRIRHLLHEKKLSIRAAREILLQERRQRLATEGEDSSPRRRPSGPVAPTPAERPLDLKELLVDLRGLIRFCDQDPFQFQNG